MTFAERLPLYARLMRLDKPIGILLLAFTSGVVWLGLRLSGQSLANTVART